MIQQFCESPDDRETETETLVAAPGHPALMKLCEDWLKLILLNTDSGIDYVQAAFAVVRYAVNLHFPAVGVANGIRHKVGNDFGQQVWIAAHDSVAGLSREFQTFAAGLAIEFRRQAIDHALNREFLKIRFYRAGVEATDIQKRVQQVRHCSQRRFLAVNHPQGTLILDSAS